LRQEPAWYDSVNVHELPSLVNQHVLNIELASGEKLAKVVLALGQVFGGFVLSFVIGWKIALVMSFVIIPVTLTSMTIMNFCSRERGKSEAFT